MYSVYPAHWNILWAAFESGESACVYACPGSWHVR